MSDNSHHQKIFLSDQSQINPSISSTSTSICSGNSIIASDDSNGNINNMFEIDASYTDESQLPFVQSRHKVTPDFPV